MFFRRFWAALLCVQMFFEIVNAGSPPPAIPGRMGAENRTREVKGLKVPLQVLILVENSLTCRANWGLLLKGRSGKAMCQGVYNVHHLRGISYLSRASTHTRIFVLLHGYKRKGRGGFEIEIKVVVEHRDVRQGV